MKRSSLVHILLNKEPSLVAGLSRSAFGGNRNPEESGGMPSKNKNSCPTEFSAKKSCDGVQKQKFLQPPPKQHSCDKLLWKNTGKKEILRNPVFILVLSPQNRFLSNRNYQPRFCRSRACSSHSWLHYQRLETDALNM